ncbi:head-tail connector protein [Sphingomonas sp. MMS24-J13]|uniref:head-tail connector protein n=1 Tax=Sphingomonas sp. MMS24-J13 TaxID=3238686 RepID=UPI00384C22ED
MRAVVITPPGPVVTYEQAVARLKLGGGDGERADVDGMIAAATGIIDGPDGYLGRAIGVQTIEARFDHFCHQDQLRCGEIILPFPPLIELVSVSYIDGSGAVQTVDPSAYEMLGQTLVPAFGTAWPTPRWQRESVRVRYRAGYPATNADPPVSTVPPAIITAILLMVGDLYRFRETVMAGSAKTEAIPMSTKVETLLGPFRVFA